MNSAVIDELRHEANAKLDPKRKGSLGQFMTPFAIAQFMASLFTNRTAAVLLDAGAGIGSLCIAANQFLDLKRIDAWEIDPVMRAYLEKSLESLSVPFQLHSEDFIHDSINRIQFRLGARFTHAILNPPYKKISSDSEHRSACRQIGIETVNLYTAFLALAILQMEQNGELVAIIPRSFCNGPYYKPFRQLLLSECSIDVIHVFESRDKAFIDDEVLQENIILKLTRGKPQANVLLSFSQDSSFADLQQSEIEFKNVVHADDKEQFIRVPSCNDLDSSSGLFSHALKDLGIEVCTGPVVDFRLKEHWSPEPQPGSAPLIYPHHFTREGFQYPKQHKKPNALLRNPVVDKWLMQEGVYVLVKRFSAKEEKKRVVAYLITPEDTRSALVGFENHWNVYHSRKQGLDLIMAKGLVCFLNSTAVDQHFRIFSGHTQVNATDLRNIKYPSLEKLQELGNAYQQTMTQEEIDLLIGEP